MDNNKDVMIHWSADTVGWAIGGDVEIKDKSPADKNPWVVTIPQVEHTQPASQAEDTGDVGCTHDDDEYQYTETDIQDIKQKIISYEQSIDELKMELEIAKKQRKGDPCKLYRKVMHELLEYFYNHQYHEKHWYWPGYDMTVEKDWDGNDYKTFYRHD